MKELKENLWTVDADCRVITTNGFVKKDGTATMGRGCALEAAVRWPELPALLGNVLRYRGNLTTLLFLGSDGPLVSLPVKHNWWEKADLGLIITSTVELVKLVDECRYKQVVLPRPGCGNGGLDWNEVGQIMAALLDDRFTVVSFEHE